MVEPRRGESSVMRLGDDELNLRNAGRGAVKLADVIERVCDRHLERAAKDLDDAFRRGWRIDE